MNLIPALALATVILSDDACSARLDQLLAIYREYGLPLPPPDASLVRNTSPQYDSIGIRVISPEDVDHAARQGITITTVKPDPVSLGKAVLQYGDLDFAIKCHARGWKPLARAAYRKWLKKPDEADVDFLGLGLESRNPDEWIPYDG